MALPELRKLPLLQHEFCPGVIGNYIRKTYKEQMNRIKRWTTVEKHSLCRERDVMIEMLIGGNFIVSKWREIL